MRLCFSALICLLTLTTCPGYSAILRSPDANASFDYVIIGGGTAGITIASRLAEDPILSVAIIEAGAFYETDNGNFSTVPGLSLSAPFLSTAVPYTPQPLVDWSLVSVPQSGASGRQIHYPQGKTLAGSSALNSMAYHRANVGAYEQWASAVGDESYRFEKLLPFFKKSCHLTPPDLEKRNTPNSTVLFDATAFEPPGGPLQVSWSNWVDPPLTWFQRAFELIGLPVSKENFNSGSITQHSAWIPSTINPDGAVRSSSQSSFLTQALKTSSIAVYPHTQANKILFGSVRSCTRAVGVSVTQENRTYTVLAKREVILSAGVFHSPQLLMVSGIGPRTTLLKHKIPLISNLAGVGQNLWDQILFSVARDVNIPTAAQLINLPQYTAITLQQYLRNASGPLSSLNGFIAFEKIPPRLRSAFTASALAALASLPADWPEVEYIGSSTIGPSGSGLGVILAALSSSFSRGNVTIDSADIADPPVINLGWLSDAGDVDTQLAVAAFKRVRQAWDSIPQITIGPELTPGPAVQSDEEILAYIRNSTSTLLHAAGTCKMGKLGDPMAVVDSRARVFGVKGLRVVDNSASPFAVPGHPQSSIYMLAEKIAEVIRRGG